MEPVWLKNYEDGVPAEINPDKYSSLLDIFDNAFANYQDNPAFSNFGKELTFCEIDKYSRDFAAFLQNNFQLNKEQRVAIMLPNILQYPIAMIGIFRAGGVVVNVNPLYTARELEHQMRDSQASIIIVLENFAHKIQKIQDKTSIRHVVVTKIGDLLPFPKGNMINFALKYLKRKVPSWKIKQAVWFNQALKIGSKKICSEITINRNDTAFLQYTGGTTGLAKGAIITHRNMVANVEQAAAWIRSAVKPGEEIILTALPLYHIFSLMANCLTYFSYGALNVLITNPRDPVSIVKQLKKYQVTAITGVNTLFNALLNTQSFETVDFSALRITLGGGMAVQHSVAERWKKVTGCVLLEAYGLTETSPAACINPINLKEYNGSIGLPISSTEVSIRDDQNNELGYGAVGELCIRGPQVMLAYWMKPEETEKVLDVDGWLRTGDMATINQQGYVKIVDRKKDMIIISGFNVYPNEVEDVIAEIDGIKEVAVVGVKDADNDEHIKVFVVADQQQVTEQQIIGYCKKNLTAYKVPKLVEFRDELPKTNVGKILRRELK